MTRIRSPNYPAMSLSEAISKIGAIHQREQHLSAPREVMARHLGYAGINGSSLKALSALLKYGLLEKTKDDQLKVTELALQILHPQSAEEKAGAIQAAASRPALFVEIAKQWPNGTPSDENLKAYLIRRNFASDAIPEVIKAYRETFELVTAESKGYAPPENIVQKARQEREQTVMQKPGQQVPPPQPAVTNYTLEGEPFRVTFTGNGIEVTGRLTTTEGADNFVGAINALKPLLRRVDEMKKPKNVDDEDEAAN